MEHTKTISDKENKMLGFREVELQVYLEKTPTTSEITKMICEKYKTAEEACSIKSIRGSFGKNLFSITARIYANKEAREKMEVKNKRPKKTPGATAPKGGKK